jgi:hypothetical protein
MILWESNFFFLIIFRPYVKKDESFERLKKEVSENFALPSLLVKSIFYLEFKFNKSLNEMH